MLDIIIAIFTTIYSEAHKMDENGEKIGFAISIVMILVYLAFSVAT